MGSISFLKKEACMRVEIILSTPVGKKLNGAADAVLRLLDDAGITRRQIVDRNYCGSATIRADIPESLFAALWQCDTVLSVRSPESRA